MGFAGDMGAFGFWMFIAAVVVGGMWFDSRKRESQQETLRRLVEGGKDVDEALLEKLLAVGNKENRKDQELTTSGLIMLFIAPGLWIFGYFMGGLAEELPTIMTGVAAMVGFIGIGLLVAGQVAKRWYEDGGA